MGLLDKFFPKFEAENMTPSQQRDYRAVKSAAETVGQVPIVGDLPLSVAHVACFAGLDALAPASCQAVREVVGELNAPPRPASVSAETQSPAR